ncbi:MAG TPA: helix-hairpin-helix domain-containing protein, partial [Longimicrobiales bacterium]|nr:helix-hairpin-helix domain-containing protein [Longimicrobiales bacterium]
MENADVAALLDELADLLEIRGANPFRVRAYRNAVRTVGGLARPLNEMVEAGEDLTELPGIGKDLAGSIEEMVTTGRFARLEEVAREVPRSLAALVKLEGVGPKKARKLWEELGIETVDALEAAARDGKVEILEGFGKRSVEKVLRAIDDLRSLTGRFRIDEAQDLVRGVLEHVGKAPGVERVEVAGSLRRRRETIGDVDILVQARDGEAVVEHFTTFPGAERVEAAGGTKGSLVLRSGLQVDLRVIPAASWGAALHYFTGSKEHNVRIRQRAQRRGLRVNEWGVWRSAGGEAVGKAEEPSGDGAETPAAGDTPPGNATPGPPGPATGLEGWERVAGATEEEVFQSVGLSWIPPELREDRGEVRAAEEGALPEVLDLGDIRGDLQMHSTWSDGKNTLEEMVLACRERGYEYVAVTDHGPSLAMVQGLTPERVRLQWEEIEEVRARVPEIRVFRSVEVDILKDGSLDLPDDVLEGMDVVVASVHSFMDLERDDMTERVLRAVRHPAVDILAHPTGRIINRRKAFAMDVEAVLQAAAEVGVAVELNANPHRLDLSDVHVRRARELGVPVVVSTDAHSVRGLDVMRYGVEQARRGWLEAGDVLNARALADLE